MPSRTQILCLHEGTDTRSIDPLFIRVLVKRLKPSWLAPWSGSNVIRTIGCSGRKELIASTPGYLKQVLNQGNQVSLMVWADLDDDMADGDKLSEEFWKACKNAQIPREDFELIVFAFAKDRLENWIEFLNNGNTDEAVEGARVKNDRPVSDAAKKLAKLCSQGRPISNLPSSLRWSCQNWKNFSKRMNS